MLKLAGYINLLIALLHIGALFCLEDVLSMTGVSESMARSRELWSPLPVLMTIGVTICFTVFGIYALAGAGVVKWRLPLLKPALYTIGAIYTLRGLLGIVLSYTDEIPRSLQLLFALVALGIGLLYIVGTLARKK